MSGKLIFVVTVLYLGVAIDQANKGNLWMALVWTGYAIANIGMMGALR